MEQEYGKIGNIDLNVIALHQWDFPYDTISDDTSVGLLKLLVHKVCHKEQGVSYPMNTFLSYLSNELPAYKQGNVLIIDYMETSDSSIKRSSANSMKIGFP